MTYYIIASYKGRNHDMELYTRSSKDCMIQLLGEYMNNKNFNELYFFGDIQIIPIYKTKEEFTKDMISYLDIKEYTNYEDLLEEYTKNKNLEETEELTELLKSIKKLKETYPFIHDTEGYIEKLNAEKISNSAFMNKVKNVERRENKFLMQRNNIKDVIEEKQKTLNPNNQDECNLIEEYKFYYDNYFIIQSTRRRIKGHFEAVQNVKDIRYRLDFWESEKERLTRRRKKFLTIEDVINRNPDFFKSNISKNIEKMRFVRFIDYVKSGEKDKDDDIMLTFEYNNVVLSFNVMKRTGDLNGEIIL